MDMGCSRTRKDRLDNLAHKTATTKVPTLPSNELIKTAPSRATERTFFTQGNHTPKKSPGSTLDNKDSFRDDNLSCFCATGAASARLLRSVGGGLDIGVSMICFAIANLGDTNDLTWPILAILPKHEFVPPKVLNALFFPVFSEGPKQPMVKGIA